MLKTDSPSQSQAMTGLLALVGGARDQAAFIELFEYYAPRIKAYLRRLGSDDAAAEEMAQEVMLTVWRKAEMFDAAKSSAGTWIFAIARNYRIDVMRREKRPEYDLEDPALMPDPSPGADEAIDAGQREDAVRAVLRELPEDQVKVLTLSFFDDKPHSVIAKELDIPLGTVKSRLRLAMKRVRTLLGDQI